MITTGKLVQLVALTRVRVAVLGQSPRIQLLRCLIGRGRICNVHLELIKGVVVFDCLAFNACAVLLGLVVDECDLNPRGSFIDGALAVFL